MIKWSGPGLDVIKVHEVSFDDPELFFIVAQVCLHPLNRVEDGTGGFEHG
jgi:hypothetical protein